MNRRPLTVLAAALVSTLAALPLHAAYDAFLKIDGVPGESTDAKHRDWIEVLSYNQSSLQQEPAQGAARRARLQIQSLSITKKQDKASPVLMKAAAQGRHFASAILHVRKAGGQEYLEYKLTDVIISSVQPSGQGGALPTESISFNFAKIEIEYKEQGKSRVGELQGAGAFSKAGAVTPPTPTATPGRPAGMVPKK